MSDTNVKPLSVTEAASYAKGKFEQIRLTIIGEISQLTNKAGYKSLYFDIKDDGATLSCKMWRNRFEKLGVRLSVGALVQISGYFTIWPAKGDVKFEVSTIALAGEGQLRQRVAMLAETLRREGLMDPARKVPLPSYPTKIGLVTSPRGAAVHDVLRTLRRRYPLGEILLAGVPVEGQYAAEYMLQGLRCVYKAGAEVILLVRGGGSFEDLMPFNDETLCRAIAKCPIPIITGIGHEPDNSIADMVADFRASTPTAAAEAVAPDLESIEADLGLSASRMLQNMQMRIQGQSMNLARLKDRPIFSDQYELLSDRSQRLDYSADRLSRAIPGGFQRDTLMLKALESRLRTAIPNALQEDVARVSMLQERMRGLMPRKVEQEKDAILVRAERMRLSGGSLLDRFGSQFAIGASRLNDLSPLAIIGRGFSLTRTEAGDIVRSINQVEPGDDINLTVSDGILSCVVRDSIQEEIIMLDSPE